MGPIPDVTKAYEAALKVAAVLLLVFVPLGVWKLVDIVLWLIHHLHWGAS